MGRWREKRRRETKERMETSLKSFDLKEKPPPLSLHTLLGIKSIWHKRKHLAKVINSLSSGEPAEELLWHHFHRKAITATFCGTVSGHFSRDEYYKLNKYW